MEVKHVREGEMIDAPRFVAVVRRSGGFQVSTGTVEAGQPTSGNPLIFYEDVASAQAAAVEWATALELDCIHMQVHRPMM